MVSLESIRPVLQPIIALLAETLKVEAAIIDRNYKLVACTDNYIIHKGTEVHTPSIDSVFDRGAIIFSRPGRMRSCRGCRFQNNCPATLEILDSIKVESNTLGIVSLSMFQRRPHALADDHIRAFERQLHRIAQLIANIVQQLAVRQTSSLWRRMLAAAFHISPQAMLCVDAQGQILEHNLPAVKTLGHEALAGESIYGLIPACRFSELWAADGKATSCALTVGALPCQVTGVPIRTEEQQFAGAVLHITAEGTAEVPMSTASATHPPAGLIGVSPAMKALKATIGKIADSRSTVLIKGETGTGKELVARAIHDSSGRKHGPFVAVNCAAIPEHLLESELFGYVKGAFTGANPHGKAGLFAMADGGTLFLDEIGEMPLDLQIKLLRAIQERAVRRVGSNRIIALNLRFIAATHQDLGAMARAGRFRQDLFYRLNVIPINVPPLRERRTDIVLLADHFLKQFNGLLNRRVTGFSPQVIDRLNAYAWPGNVRELENAVEYAVNLEEGRVIRISSLPATLQPLTSDDRSRLDTAVASAEKQAIVHALQTFGSHLDGKQKAAAHLGMSLRTLYRKIQKYHLR